MKRLALAFGALTLLAATPAMAADLGGLRTRPRRHLP